jgi:hypothetical protein
MHKHCILMAGVAFFLFALPVVAVAAPPLEEVRRAVEEDWAQQEIRFDRKAGDLASIEAALQRAQQLLEDQAAQAQTPDLSRDQARLRELSAMADHARTLSESERLALYHDLRWFTRNLALRNPIFADRPILFMQRHRFICQMLHEYLGYYYDYGDIAGGGIYLLKNPGHSFEKEDLMQGRLPRGNYTTLALAYDAKTIYFAFASRADRKPHFYSPERRSFHLYAMDLDGGHLRALTSGPEDDFDPCPLPDGGIAFMSSRRGGFTRCNNPWEPLPAHTLHRLDPDGTIRTLSYHETSEWHPKVLADGRIAYIRWDYVDRSAAHFHGIWTTNPDGTNSRGLFGNYTQDINACYQPHPIPGSAKVAFLAGAHHANVGGSLVLLDPARLSLRPDNGEDCFNAIERLTPEVSFAETPGNWPTSYVHSPWPLSENYYLMSFSFDPLPGMSALTEEDTKTGLYLFDRFGNLELLYRDPEISSMYPIPAVPRPAPPVIPSTLDPELGDEGEFLLSNVYDSHIPFPEERPIETLNIYQLLPKSETHVANRPRIGYANAESARMLLGSVPVEADGSAYFRAPAGKPLAFQAIDTEGRAVQGMRSAAYLQPGERRSCIGCHESTGRTGSGGPANRLMAAQRPPSTIEAGPDGTLPWSFPRLVQPILDRHCVRCHDDEAASTLKLTGRRAGQFSEAYQALRPYVRWYEWGGESISVIVTRPGEMPADLSPLTAILHDENHRDELTMSGDDWRTLYLWMDGNAAFYGVYSMRDQVAQRHGEAILPPELQ